MDIAECSLAELMDDPLIGLVMKSDAVDRRELELLLAQVTHQRWLATAPANSYRALCGSKLRSGVKCST